MKKIDKLPTGPEWFCDNVVGDVNGPNGEPLTEELELWRRDPVDCCRELMGNPAFEDFMAYEPVRMTRDGVRYYGEMNTSDWWWNAQVSHNMTRYVLSDCLLSVSIGKASAWGMRRAVHPILR